MGRGRGRKVGWLRTARRREGGWGNDSLESVLCRLLDGVPLAAELARLDLRERGKFAISGPYASEVQGKLHERSIGMGHGHVADC
jgi:hypothetical protein